MKKLFVIALIGVLCINLSVSVDSLPLGTIINKKNQQGVSPIIADHTVVHYVMNNLIPEDVILNVRDMLNVSYEHTSHGRQISTGTAGLSRYMETKHGVTKDLFNWSDPWNYNQPHPDYQEGYLNFDDDGMGFYPPVASDLGYSGWNNCTQAYLDDIRNIGTNVVMWSWCGQLGYDITSQQELYDHYLNPMAQLEINYPEVTFIYMTGHVDGTGPSGLTATNNQLIRDYCLANNKVLFDFADIESYNPDGIYFGEYRIYDTCNYAFENGTNGNWATEWQNANPGDWYSCDSAHSQPLNANMKAYAIWWLFARISGWNENESSSSDPISNSDDLSSNSSYSSSSNPISDSTGLSDFFVIFLTSILFICIKRKFNKGK